MLGEGCALASRGAPLSTRVASVPATEALLCVLQGKKRISCPTCRTRVIAADMAYVALRQADGAQHQAGVDEEAGVEVRGSYGTKVRSWLVWAGS